MLYYVALAKESIQVRERGGNIACARSPRRLNLVRWCLIVVSQYETCFMVSLRRLQFSGGCLIFFLFMDS